VFILFKSLVACFEIIVIFDIFSLRFIEIFMLNIDFLGFLIRQNSSKKNDGSLFYYFGKKNRNL